LVFQDGKLIPSLNVIQNVCVPLVHQGIRPARQKELACAMLERVGLGHRLHQKVHHLSGGETIRAAIARALVINPRIVLADEPTGTLDSRMGAQIADLLLSVTRDDMALVMVTHNEALAGRADRIVRIADGLISVSEDRRASERSAGASLGTEAGGGLRVPSGGGAAPAAPGDSGTGRKGSA
jgi:putative ABC transport system ATP-binding protein